METRYYVCGLVYDKFDCITDYEHEFGSFDTFEEARKRMEKVIQEAEKNLDVFFHDDETEAQYWIIQLEKCHENNGVVECYDVVEDYKIEK